VVTWGPKLGPSKKSAFRSIPPGSSSRMATGPALRFLPSRQDQPFDAGDRLGENASSRPEFPSSGPVSHQFFSASVTARRALPNKACSFAAARRIVTLAPPRLEQGAVCQARWPDVSPADHEGSALRHNHSPPFRNPLRLAITLAFLPWSMEQANPPRSPALGRKRKGEESRQGRSWSRLRTGSAEAGFYTGPVTIEGIRQPRPDAGAKKTI